MSNTEAAILVNSIVAISSPIDNPRYIFLVYNWFFLDLPLTCRFQKYLKICVFLLSFVCRYCRARLNIDFYTEGFYRKINKLWLEHRMPKMTRDLITNQTNTCCIATNSLETIEHEPKSEHDSNSSIKLNDKRYFLKDVLLITVGGGSRDILVQSSMTTSQFSDIHVMR